MHDLAVEQICNGGEANMRMRAHIEPVAGVEFRRAKMVEKNEWADHPRARAEGSARRTAKSPRSTVRGTITWSIASH